MQAGTGWQRTIFQAMAFVVEGLGGVSRFLEVFAHGPIKWKFLELCHSGVAKTLDRTAFYYVQAARLPSPE